MISQTQLARSENWISVEKDDVDLGHRMQFLDVADDKFPIHRQLTGLEALTLNGYPMHEGRSL